MFRHPAEPHYQLLLLLKIVYIKIVVAERYIRMTPNRVIERTTHEMNW